MHSHATGQRVSLNVSKRILSSSFPSKTCHRKQTKARVNMKDCSFMYRGTRKWVRSDFQEANVAGECRKSVLARGKDRRAMRSAIVSKEGPNPMN